MLCIVRDLGPRPTTGRPSSMERYHEAFRIQMTDSQDSKEVARTLVGEYGTLSATRTCLMFDLQAYYLTKCACLIRRVSYSYGNLPLQP